jgi:serine/threonine protein kinase
VALAPGTRVGPYEITAQIGVGGMGEVWSATDTNLGRQVAIKVLPDTFASEPERLARFEREAKTLAALNHPHIAQIYGLERSGAIPSLVMELVEGPTLADRIAGGPIPIDEAFPIARQICQALEAAHEHGIIHRDLKPANVKVRPDGTVKVLDFGLAKALEPAGVTPTASQSPTITTPAMTQAGIILGTAAYMSPEQARGKQVDKRVDIWAFGCVVYEMLTGQRAFSGEDVSDTLASVLAREPAWGALPIDVPPAIRTLLKRCLEKDRTDRIRDISTASFLLTDHAALAPTRSTSAVVRDTQSGPLFRRIVLSGFAATLLVAAIAGAVVWRRNPSEPLTRQSTLRFSLALPVGDQIAALDRVPSIALAPDGSKLAYVASREGQPRRLFVKSIDELQPKSLPGTEDAENPFFSPSGEWIGFFAGGQLKKVSAKGGASIALSSAPLDFGATWLSNDAILFANNFGSGLAEVSAAGGAPKSLTKVDIDAGEAGHQWPQTLPGGQAVVFYLAKRTARTFDEGDIVVQSLTTGARNLLVSGATSPQYVPTGHLLYVRAGTVFAVGFDVQRLAVRGAAIPVIEGVAQSGLGAAHFSAGHDGSLAYLARDRYQPNSVWVTRTGERQRLPVPFGLYTQPQVSADGLRVLFRTYGINCDLWVYDTARTTLTRVTLHGDNHNPIWSPDGRRIAFDRDVNGVRAIFTTSADGTGVEERLLTSSHSQTPQMWSMTNETLVFLDTDPSTGAQDIWWLPVAGDRIPRAFLRSPFRKSGPKLSPDGQWIAYTSNESGRDQVYVQPFPKGGAKSQVSTEGGREPVWNRNGRELFYRNGDFLMSVDVRTNPAFDAGQPRILMRGQGQVSGYDVSADGQRFLFIEQDGAPGTPAQVNLILNWFEELKRLVPTN